MVRTEDGDTRRCLRSVQPHSLKPPQTYELVDPTCPYSADSIDHNGATILTDYLFYLPRERDYRKPEVISRDWPPDSGRLDELQPLSVGSVRPPDCIARVKGSNVEVRGSRGPPVWLRGMDPVGCDYQTLRVEHHMMMLRILGAWCR